VDLKSGYFGGKGIIAESVDNHSFFPTGLSPGFAQLKYR